MSNDLTNFNNRPSFLQTSNVDNGITTLQDLVGGGVDYPIISKSNNRHFTIRMPDGTVVPQKPESLPLVFLKVNQVRSYYSSKYTPDSDSMPDCMSHNGLYPDKRSPNPQSTTCKGCKQNVFDETLEVPGFRCKKNIECCVVPTGMLSKAPSNAPLLYMLRLTVADYKFDKKNPDQTNFLPYIDMLTKNNTRMHWVVTRTTVDRSGKFRFDKAGFTFDRWLNEQEVTRAEQLLQSKDCDHIIGLDLEPLTLVDAPAVTQPVQQQPVQQQPVQQQPVQQQPVQQQPVQQQPVQSFDDLFGSDEPQQPQPQQQAQQSSDDDFFNSLGGNEPATPQQKPVSNVNQLPKAVDSALDWLNT